MNKESEQRCSRDQVIRFSLEAQQRLSVEEGFLKHCGGSLADRGVTEQRRFNQKDRGRGDVRTHGQ